MRGLTPEQHAWRALGLGGSDAGRVMSGDWRQLFLEKTGRARPEDLSWTIPVQIGHCTEQFNAEYFEHVTGRPVERRGEAVVSKQYAWMRANLDGTTMTAAGKFAYWDAKHVGRSDEKMVLRYTPQMTHCCIILGYDHWVLSVLVGNSKHEIIEQQVDPFYAEELITLEREFWGYVERDEEPRDRAEPVAAPKPEARLRNIDLSAEWGSDEWKALVAKYNWAAEAAGAIQRFRETERAFKIHSIARDDIKKLVPDDVGELRRDDFLFARAKNGAVTMKIEGKTDA